ncbi:MAG: leucine-rich repeat protein [Bacteroidales bacterium]|jgi:hypothetical protein|nr:leucine-rich repeat protein [Bacteroidales bacterium]
MKVSRKINKAMRVTHYSKMICLLLALCAASTSSFAQNDRRQNDNVYPPYSPPDVSLQQAPQLRSTIGSWQIGYPIASTVTATLDDNGTLIISGIGAVSEYTLAPWFSVKDQIINVDIQSGVTNIGERYFSDCTGLVRVDIASTVTSIDEQAFIGCTNLKRIRIPHNVVFIGVECFKDCKNLETINIPSSVSTLGGAAFDGCYALRNISVRQNSPLNIGASDVFKLLNTQNINLYIPKGLLNVYNASDWQNFNVIESNDWKLLCPILGNVQFNGVYSETTSGTTTSFSAAEYNNIYTFFLDYENLVEYLVPSLDLKLDIKNHTSLITSTAEYSGYPCIDRIDIHSALTSYGYNTNSCNSNYDGVITIADLKDPDIPTSYGGLTWLGAEYYSFIPYRWWFEESSLYSYTLYVFVHEWLHQLEDYFPNRFGVIIPDLHDGSEDCIYEGDYHDAYLTNNLSGCGSTGINSTWFQYAPTNCRPPSNDNCSSATTLSCGNSTTGTTIEATPTTSVSYGTDRNGWNTTNAPDVFYKFTAQNTGTHTITLTNSGTADIDLHLYSSCGSTTSIGNLSSPGTLHLSCYANTTYYIRAVKHTGGDIFTVKVDCPNSSAIENILADKLEIYPNPAKSEIIIKSDLQIKKVEIYSVTGSLLKIEDDINNKISVSTLPKGVYMVKIHTSKGTAIKKVVKE